MKIELTPEILSNGNQYPADLFEDYTHETSGGRHYWSAYAYGTEIDVWRSVDGIQKKVLDTNGFDEDHRQRVRDGAFAELGLKYDGTLSRGEALAGCLVWLAKNTDEEGNLLPPPIDPNSRDYDHEIAGVLDGPGGLVFVTGIGASIFGSHIRAMQENGDAEYWEV